MSRTDRYILLEQLGKGGMGRVVRAYDRELRRDVALKFLRPKCQDELAVERIKREARAMARLSHPNVLRVFDVQGDAAGVFIAMEYSDGGTMRQWLLEDRRDWQDVVARFCAAGRGLAAAHDAGIVHRDFKPSNVVFGRDGSVKVTDFGVARSSGDSEAEPTPFAWFSPERGLTTLTGEGTVIGTPAYMAPEQRAGARPDASSDQYSFCVALHEALFGYRPDLAPATRAAPAWLRSVVRRGLAPDPTKRWPTMRALLTALQRGHARGRRRLLHAATLVGASAALVGWLDLAGPATQVCSGANAQANELWRAARKHELERTFVATGHGHARDSWAAVERQLDTYMDEWVAEHESSCAATQRSEQSREALDLQLACLGSRLGEVRAILEVLSDADETVVEHAVSMPAGLPALASCRNADSADALRPPQVEAVRQQLVTARALKSAGKTVAGFALARESEQRAHRLGDSFLIASAEIVIGELERASGAFDRAHVRLETAYFVAREGGHDRSAVLAASDLASLEATKAHHDAALRWVRHAEAGLERTPDRAQRAELDRVRGYVYSDLGHYPEAVVAHRQAYETMLALRGPDHPATGNIQIQLGTSLNSDGRTAEALEHFSAGIAVLESSFGQHHPSVATALGNLGNVLKSSGRYHEALAHYRRCEMIRRRVQGPASVAVATAINNVGVVLSRMGRPREALESSREALRIWQAAHGPQNPRVAMSVGNMGNALLRLGRAEEALHHYRRAEAIFARAYGPVHPMRALALQGIAEALSGAGRRQEALELAARAARVGERAFGPHHPMFANMLAEHAGQLHDGGRDREAQALLLRALAILDRYSSSLHPFRGFVLSQLGYLHLQAGDHGRAVYYLEQALALRNIVEGKAGDLATTKFLLARALWPGASDRRRALGLARQAAATLSSTGPTNPQDLARVEAWLAARA